MALARAWPRPARSVRTRSIAVVESEEMVPFHEDVHSSVDREKLRIDDLLVFSEAETLTCPPVYHPRGGVRVICYLFTAKCGAAACRCPHRQQRDF